MRLIPEKYSSPAMQSPMDNNPGSDFHTQSYRAKRNTGRQKITTSKYQAQAFSDVDSN